MAVQVAVDADSKAFDSLGNILRQLRIPLDSDLDRIERGVRAGFAGNFARESRAGGPPWAPLRPRTQRERRAQGYPPTRPILVRSGAYRRTWTEVGGWRDLRRDAGGWTLSVSSGHPYARDHELGRRARNLPARPVRFLDTGQVAVVAVYVEDWVDRVIRSVS